VAVPSEWFENAPFAALEAMAMARPVLASRLGGLPELILDGETGVLLPPGDLGRWTASLAAAVADPARLCELGARARQRATESFGFETHVAAVESIYYEVCR
jgi:glycosyltransferase involved in cell wall biosynthesis